MPVDLRLDKIKDEGLKSIFTSFKGECAECGLPARLLDRRLQLPGWNLSPLELQEACTRLLGWIQEHPAQAERCFPAFCREENQMKLLTPKAAVSLRKKADRLGELLALAGTEDPEELAGQIQGGLHESPSKIPGGFMDIDLDSGIFFDGDWDDTWGEGRRDRLRHIGEAGERHAFQAVALRPFRNVIGHLADGTLRNAEGRYILRWEEIAEPEYRECSVK